MINTQDTFLGAAMRNQKHVILYLLPDVKISGKLRLFDDYSLVIETEKLIHLVPKHAIATVLICRDRKCPDCFPQDEFRQPIDAPPVE